MQDDQINALANQVLDFARNKLLVNLRFMNVALSYHKRREYSGLFATDGRTLLYDPIPLLRMYRDSLEEFVHLYLHTIFHCVFLHPFVGPAVDQRLWNIASDIAVEKTIQDLNLPGIRGSREQKQKGVLSDIEKKLSLVTTEKLYSWFSKGSVSDDTLSEWEKVFVFDDHFPWYSRENESGVGDQVGSLSTDGQADGSNGLQYGIKEFWKNTAEQILMDLTTFGKSRGDKAGGLIQNLSEVSREKYDYAGFLKKFAVLGETMKVNEDEFDYIYYTYGLAHYDKKPFIEPLEYKEEKRIREFVIAIDTSGSVAGEEVQLFLQKTYNILKQQESYFRKINIHIIQCDADIQEDVVVTNQKEFDDYLKIMKLHGFGGTDFRPVFEYVDKLISQKEFRNLKGMLYFTDGYGVFPKHKPPYSTAFVFVSDNYQIPEIPPWAIKLVLQKEELIPEVRV